MILIRSINDVNDTQIAPKHRPLVTSILEDIIQVYGDSYDCTESPYLVYLNDPDDLTDLSEIGLQSALTDLVFEGGRYHAEAQCYELIRVANNSFAMTFIIPDRLLTKAVRQFIIEQY